MGDFEYVRELVRRNSAIILDESQDYLIEARLAPLAKDQGFGSVDNLIATLRSKNPGTAHGKVVEALTTNETRFFRDIHPFRLLTKEVIPRLLEKNQDTKTLRIWSAACSTGQEPYSIAMALYDEHPVLHNWKVKILATDLNEVVLERARSGVYKQLEVNRGLPARNLVKHFHRIGNAWKVKPYLENVCEFKKLNLISAWGKMPTFDIVFLRNVLIYFDVAAKNDVLSRVAKNLYPGGYLFLGAAETVVDSKDSFSRAFAGPGGCYERIGG